MKRPGGYQFDLAGFLFVGWVLFVACYIGHQLWKYGCIAPPCAIR